MLETVRDFVITAWNEFVENIYANNESVAVYLLKAFFVVIIYVIISDNIKRLFKKIDEDLEEKNENKSLRVLGLGGLMYLILSVLVMIMFNILNRMEVEPAVTLVVLLVVFLLMVVNGVFLSLISKIVKYFKKNSYDDYYDLSEDFTVVEKPSIFRNSNVRRLFRLLGHLVIVLLLVFVVNLSYRGIVYMLGSGGEEISWTFSMADNLIGLKLDTKFKKADASDKIIPVYTFGKMTVKSDGEINIVYVDGRRVGFNTESRDYKMYGIAVNQRAVDISKKTTFFYDKKVRTLEDAYGSNSDTIYYVNSEDNECVAVTVNNTSNRVIAVSYFTDFEKVTENAILSVE